MNGTNDVGDPEAVSQQESYPLDSLSPAEKMEAINSAMQQYFGVEDWLRERNKKFPGVRHYRFEEPGLP